MIEAIYFGSVTSKAGVVKKLTLDGLRELVKSPVVPEIDSKSFARLSTKDKLAYKDVGGYVFAKSADNTRTHDSILFRTATTLDIDDGRNVDLDKLAALIGYKMFVHTTISSTPVNPRYRVIIPFATPATLEEFANVTDYFVKQAELLKIKVDGCSTVVTQIMFSPTVLQDMQQYYVGEEYNDRVVKPSSILGDSQSVESKVLRRVSEQQNPRTKKGFIGAFCTRYDIHEAIESMLSDVYVEGTMKDSYTYVLGTSQNGLKVYEDSFVYSFHDSDPCSHRLCHSFDLVRIHKFGNLDREAGVDYGNPHAPSFKMMVSFCRDVLKLQPIGSWDFSFLDDDSWVDQLTFNKRGIEGSAHNIDLIFKNDSNLRGIYGYNLFEGRISLVKSAPWRDVPEPSVLREVDFSGLRQYFDFYYGITASGKIEDAMVLNAHDNSFHPVIDYLTPLKWDGIKRVDKVLIDYMGAADNDLTKAVFRKFLLGAINRVFNPGYKFDYMLILVGLRQGEGKSTLGSLLARKWFSDSFLSFTGKESFEQLQGNWFIEIGELAGMRKTEIESIKHFISKRVDRFRPAYGRVIEDYPRQCVFFGTTNEMEFLKDPSGNRRFWPVLCDTKLAKRSIWEAEFIQSIDQIWAEAMHYYREGEGTELDKKLWSEVAAIQRAHVDADVRLGVVESFLDKKINKEYIQANTLSRIALLNKGMPDGTERTHVSALEVWAECFERDKTEVNGRESREINGILRMLGWIPGGVKWVNKYYGSQRVYERPK